MYAAEKEIPYQLTIESGGVETEQKQFRVLQPASVGGKTQFILDMSGVPEYDRINLKLATKNFVAHARVEGQDDLHGKHWALLGSHHSLRPHRRKARRQQHSADSTQRLQISARHRRQRRQASRRRKRHRRSHARRKSGLARNRQRCQTRTAGKRHRLDLLHPCQHPRRPSHSANRSLARKFPPRNRYPRPRTAIFGSGEISRIHMQRNGQKVDVEQTSIDLCGNCQGYSQSDNSQRRRHAPAHHQRASATDGAPHLLRFRRRAATVDLLRRRKTRPPGVRLRQIIPERKNRGPSRARRQKSSTPPTPAGPTAARGPSVIRLYYGSPSSPPY